MTKQQRPLVTKADVDRLEGQHRSMLREQLSGCMVFWAGISLIFIAFIIAGLR